MYPKVSNWLSVYTSRVEIGSYNNAVKEMDNSQIEALEKKEEDWHRKLKKNAERKKLKSNALPTAKAL